MRPLATLDSLGIETGPDTPRVNENESLSKLIRLAIDDDAPILVEDGGAVVGVITRADLLRTVVEGTEMS